MKTAREMFKELDLYEQNLDEAFIDKVIMYSKPFCELVITFYLDKKEIAIDSLKDNQGKRYELNYEIFQAINKQVEELWGEE